MKKSKFLMWGLALFAGFAMTACSSSSDDDNGGGGGGSDAPAPTEFTKANLMGMVVDNYGSSIKGVTVTSGTNVATTDANGVFTLDKVVTEAGRSVVKFTKSGYVDIVKSMPQKDGDTWTVVMIPDNNATTSTFSAASPTPLSINNNFGRSMNVELPANGFKDANGRTYNGIVKAKAVYLTPDASNFASAMPGGDLAAQREDGSDAQLVSYGMSSVELTDAEGKQLQLADGKEATLTFPVPNSMKENTPDEIPLWYFDESTGLWKEEGKATKQGDFYVGKVKHFSWWNLDYPYSRATLKVSVVDDNGKSLPNIWVNIDNGQRLLCTNDDGQLECFVPSDTKFDVKVTQDHFTYLSGQEERSVTVEKLTAGTTKEVTLKLPSVAIVSGTITNTGNGSKVCAVALSLPGNSDVGVISDLFGHYRMVIPKSYKGVATVAANSSEGKEAFANVTLDGTDKVVNLTINSNVNPDQTAGYLVLTDEDKNKATITFGVQEGIDRWGGASLVDDILQLSYSYYSNEDGVQKSQSFYVTISEYSTSKTNYTAQLSVRSYEGGTETNVVAREANYEIKKSGSNFEIKVVADQASYTMYKQGSGSSSKTCSLEMTLKVPVSCVAKSYINVDQSTVKSLLPDFMPYIAGKKLHALVVTECPAMGTGGVICYTDTTITDAEYNTLATQAEKALGKPVNADVDPDRKEEMEHHGVGPTYFQNPKYISFGRNPWYKENMKYSQMNDDSFSFAGEASNYIFSPENHNAFITVRAFTNVQIPITDLVFF